MKKKVKNILYYILKLYEFTLGRLLYTGAKRYASFHTNLMHYTDWYFNPNEPSSYKHEINLYNWIYKPSQVEFAEGGVFGRMLINQGDKVLDLCCGDGSYSYLFFSDISSEVDAVDYDKDSIKYANNNYNKKNINYICSDLMQCDFKKEYYDVIIWRSGSAYFTKDERKKLFLKMANSLKKDGNIYLGTPLMKNENFSANQIEVITDEELYEKEFSDIFHIKFKQKTFYENRININYILEKIE
jgi:cyclopropane fatty-acyl-phospholipid synthase-like methyltransferase